MSYIAAVSHNNIIINTTLVVKCSRDNTVTVHMKCGKKVWTPDPYCLPSLYTHVLAYSYVMVDLNGDCVLMMIPGTSVTIYEYRLTNGYNLIISRADFIRLILDINKYLKAPITHDPSCIRSNGSAIEFLQWDPEAHYYSLLFRISPEVIPTVEPGSLITVSGNKIRFGNTKITISDDEPCSRLVTVKTPSYVCSMLMSTLMVKKLIDMLVEESNV